jgi:DNA-binding MarR family transcriptional regulator
MRKIASRPSLPDAGKGMRGEQGHLGYLLRQAAGVFRLRMERVLADLDVTPPQFSVLTMLSAYPGHSNADLARLALLTPQTVSVIVANLERKHAIVRHPHPVHGRIQNLELSKRGGLLLAECRRRVHALERELVVDLSSSDQKAVIRWLAQVAADAKAS